MVDIDESGNSWDIFNKPICMCDTAPQVGMTCCKDIVFGDYIYFVIDDILSLPTRVDPDNPDSGNRWTFHLVLRALNESYNTVQYNGRLIYGITPLGDMNLFYCTHHENLE